MTVKQQLERLIREQLQLISVYHMKPEELNMQRISEIAYEIKNLISKLEESKL